jgi:acyl-coenzyme A synthetase/AMP-(fatty) acid ligase/thioesterase domain-containing protein
MLQRRNDDDRWHIARGDLPIDHDGPTDVAFDRFDDDRIERPIAELFNQIAIRHAGKAAIVDETTSLTYRELRNASFHLARRIDAVVPPGKPVGILLPNNALFPVAALACLTVGRPYVPIDPTYPSIRADQIREEAGLSAIIFNRVDGQIFYGGSSLPYLDIGTSLLDGADIPPPAIANPGGPAVILYTSGSTGRPKGICNDQRAIVQRVAQAANSCHVNAGDRFFLLSSPGTIAGVRETFSALLNGATLYVTDPNRLGINGVLQMLSSAGATIGYAVPALLRQLLAAPDARAAFAQARIVRIGGDMPVKEDLELCRAVLPASCRILFAFSSTELPTIFQWFVPRDWQPDSTRLPIGYARAGMDFKIETDGEADGAGELIVRSRYLALGHWQTGQLQAGPFQTDQADPSARILRTGDRVRLRPDGLVEMTGRLDRQIKMRGSRVDLAEVEAVLRGCANVADVAVIPRRQGEDVSALVAYVVPRGPQSATFEADLKATLAQHLPRRMCPAQFRVLDALPRLRGFKTDVQALMRLDQRELAALDSSTDEVSAAAIVPSTTSSDSRAHDAVARAWTTIVGRRAFQANMPWDEAGGDSLAALQLWCLIEEALGTRLAIDRLELNATPTMFIAEVERQLCSSEVASSLAPLVFFLPSADGDTPLQAQFRAAFHHQIRFEVVEYPPWREMIDAGANFGVIIEAAVDQILAKSNGDIFLAGYSFGGFVASEVARRLTELHRRVSFVGLIDTQFDFQLPAHQSKLSKIGNLIRKIFLHPASLEVTLLKALAKNSAFGILRRIGELTSLLPAPTAFKRHYYLNYHLRVQSRHGWRLKPVQAPTYLFRTNEFPQSSALSTWGALASHLEIVPVGGTHFSILRPPAREVLCQQFLKAINAAKETAKDAVEDATKSNFGLTFSETDLPKICDPPKIFDLRET